MILSWHRTFTGCTCRPIAALFYIWSAFHSRIFISHIIGSSYNIGSSKNILTYIFIWQSDIHWHFGSLCYIINSLDILYLYTMAIGSSNDDRIFIWHRIFFKWRSDLQMTIGYSFDIGSSSNDDWIFKWQSDIHLTCWFFNAAHPVDLHNARLRRMKKRAYRSSVDISAPTSKIQRSRLIICYKINSPVLLIQIAHLHRVVETYHLDQVMT